MHHKQAGNLRSLAFAIVIGTLSFKALAADVISLQGAEQQKALKHYTAQIAKQPKDVEALKSAGIILHQMSRVKAEREQVEQAENYLKQAKSLAPTDQETAAWLGSVTTMKALFETDPGKQTLWVKVGSKMMDAAVKNAPDNQVVRLTRATNSLELPPFLRRTRFAVEDFNAYLKLCAKQSCPPAMVEDARGKLKRAEQVLAQNP